MSSDSCEYINQWSLFRKGGKAVMGHKSWPDVNGSIVVKCEGCGCVREYWMDGWDREGRGGVRYIGGRIKPKDGGGWGAGKDGKGRVGLELRGGRVVKPGGDGGEGVGGDDGVPVWQQRNTDGDVDGMPF